MLHVRRLWHFIPADASVNVKDRAKALHIPVCANRLRAVINDASQERVHGIPIPESALGHKRTFDVIQPMSALPQKRTDPAIIVPDWRQ
jgi:hypothetical protein